MDDILLKKLEKKLKYQFQDKNLLKRALTHKTYAFEAKTPIEYNERLEFLGDSLIGFVVAEELYKSNKYFSEGELTRRRSTIVNNSFLAERAEKLGLGKYLFLGKGEIKQKGEKNSTNLANALEALIGAVYLDSDLNTVCYFVKNNIFDEKIKF